MKITPKVGDYVSHRRCDGKGRYLIDRRTGDLTQEYVISVVAEISDGDRPIARLNNCTSEWAVDNLMLCDQFAEWVNEVRREYTKL